MAQPRYELVCRLAGGGMAELHLAKMAGPGGFERLLVVKRLKPQLAGDPGAVQGLLDEARIAATLQHAHIVQVHDVEIADGEVSIAMEFLHGHDLRDLMRRLGRAGGRVPLDQAIAITLAICAGLHHAHERVAASGAPLGIVHRDISPHNVLVTYDGSVKVVDFGIARAATRLGQTDLGVIKGKPGYMAPEQVQGADVDRRADVWAAAVLLYEMTVGAPPFAAETVYALITKCVESDAPRPSTRVPGYDRELETIVMRGLARDPAARYPTAAAMSRDLEAFARRRGLDLSTFGLAALMERVFAVPLAAWRDAQREGRSLAEHVAALRTTGAIDVVEVPELAGGTVTHATPTPSPARPRSWFPVILGAALLAAAAVAVIAWRTGVGPADRPPASAVQDDAPPPPPERAVYDTAPTVQAESADAAPVDREVQEPPRRIRKKREKERDVTDEVAPPPPPDPDAPLPR